MIKCFVDTQQHIKTKSAHQKPDAINMNEMCDKWMYQGHSIANTKKDVDSFSDILLGKG